MAAVELPSGRILFREGAASRHIFRVVSGEIEVSRGTGDRTVVLGRVGPGHFVGEMGALVSARRNGTARAVSDTNLRRYRRREFLLEVVRDPELSARVLNGLSLRTRAQVEFLRGSPAHRRPSLFRRVVEWLRSLLKRPPRQGPLRAAIGRSGFGRQEFAQGAALFEEGAASDGVFWIESGRVLVRTKDASGAERRAGHAGAGEFVGEMGVLESLPRSAAAVAATRVVAVKMSPEEFTALLRRSPSAVLTVIDALCERARRTRARAAAWDGHSSNLLEALRSVDSMAQLAQYRLADEAWRARAYVTAQWDRGKIMSATYRRYLRGTATAEELEHANTVLRDYLKIAGLGTLLVLPGAPITIPLAVKLGKALGVNILPSEVEAEMT
jgi:CRP-like cAMP-binding protein